VSTTRVARIIDAPIAKVFDAVAHIDRFQQVVPGITKIEHLTETTRGVGSRFRETRLMGKRESTTELEVTEYVENERVRLVTDAGGTIWDTVFTVREADGKVELVLLMDARAYKLLAKLMNPLIKGMITKAISGDMDAVKVYCEA
jgi:uncharacterized protein YndB with AHSA1/START domain